MRVILLLIVLTINTLGFSQTDTHKDAKQCLDSVITSGQYGNQKKEHFIYDQYGNNITEISYYQPGTSWVEDFKYEYEYDAQGNKIKEIYSSWNSVEWEWESYRKYEYTYDTKGNQIELIAYYRGDNNWKNDYKEESTYNKDGHLLFTYSFEWNNTWKMTSIIEHTYNIDGNLIMSIEFKRSDTTATWINFYKEERNYNVNKNQILLTSYYWTDIGWIKNERDSFMYDFNGNLLTNIHYVWIDTNWTENTKYEYEYAPDGNKAIFTSYSWVNATWTGDVRYKYAYDTNKNLIMYRYYSWNGVDWIEIFKYESSYNLLYSKTDLILPNSYNDMDNKLLLEVGYWWEKTGWVANEIITYYWSNKNVRIGQLQVANYGLQVYPNPTTGQLTIENGSSTGSLPGDGTLSVVEVYDVVGKLQKVESKKQNGKIEIDISHLANGLYFLQIDNKMFKIIKN